MERFSILRSGNGDHDDDDTSELGSSFCGPVLDLTTSGSMGGRDRCASFEPKSLGLVWASPFANKPIPGFSF